jgi:uncharacterized protein (UPF0335 family)
MTDAVTADELRQFIERHEQLDAETSDIAAQRSDLMAELRGRGYDGKAFKEVIRLRKMKPDQRAEFEAVVELYREAAGLA